MASVTLVAMSTGNAAEEAHYFECQAISVRMCEGTFGQAGSNRCKSWIPLPASSEGKFSLTSTNGQWFRVGRFRAQMTEVIPTDPEQWLGFKYTSSDGTGVIMALNRFTAEATEITDAVDGERLETRSKCVRRDRQF